MKEHNFSAKTKIGQPFKGPFKITKVHSNGTALIRTKSSKDDHLVNTNLLVKYNKPILFEKTQVLDNKNQEDKNPEPNSDVKKTRKEVFHQDLMVIQ
jgi:hypothetical protein